jgi:hypothetical protein
MLRDPAQEFILLLDEKGAFELVPYERVATVAGGSREVIAYLFERKGALYAVYNHISADKRLELPLDPDGLSVLENLGDARAAAAGERGDTAVVPIGKRRYPQNGHPAADRIDQGRSLARASWTRERNFCRKPARQRARHSQNPSIRPATDYGTRHRLRADDRYRRPAGRGAGPDRPAARRLRHCAVRLRG